MRTPIEEKPEIHKINNVLAPWKLHMLKLFYGNDYTDVYDYWWHYTRPSEEELEEWHEISMSQK
jgi:hypothetical protein